MSSPGGIDKEVGRVSVRVLPDTGQFDEKLRAALKDLPDAIVTVKFELDREQLKRELATLEGTSITIPVHFNVDNVRDDIERATAGAQADPVQVPVEIDKDALDQQTQDLDNLPPINQPIDVNPAQAAAEATQAAEAAQAAVNANPIDLPFTIDDRRALNALLKDIRIDPIQVPLELDDLEFSAELQRAVAQGELIARNPILFQLDMDQREFERKVAETEAQINLLRTEGITIALRAKSEQLDAAIAKATAELETLQAQKWTAEVQVKIDEKRGELAALLTELAALDSTTVEPAVRMQIEEALVQLAGFAAQLRAIDGKRIKVIAEMDVDTLAADAEISAFIARNRNRRKITIPVDIDRDRLGLVTSGLADRFANVFSDIGSLFTGRLSAAADAVSSHFEGMGEALQGPLGVALQLSTVVLQLGAISAALAVAGAGITAAWGAVSTAIAAIPGALGFAAAAGATVFLGLKGIKAAAKAIKPEFDALKASVSATFEKGLTPIFAHLATIFPKVRDSINNVASALVNSAFSFTQFLTSSRGVATLNTIFNNTAQALRNMQPGLDAIVQTFLTLAAQAGVFDVLTSAVNTFGAAFKKDVTDQLGDGTLARAFEGLRGLLDQLAIGFADLVKNGISVFVGAAPGVNAFFRDLTGFFNRFDWVKLGQAVGGVFEGLGAALRNVPQSTITNIEQAFGRLADVFKDPRFQADLTNIIDNLPAAIDTIGELTRAFGDLASALSDVLGAIDKVDQKLRPFIDWLNHLGLNDKNKPILPMTKDSGWWQSFNDWLDTNIQKVKDKVGKFSDFLAHGGLSGGVRGQSVGSGGNPFGGFFDNFKFPSLPDLPSFGDIAAPGLGSGWDSLSTDVKNVFDAMAAAAQTGVRQLLDAVTSGTTQVSAALSFSNVRNSIGLVFLGMVGTTRLGMESIAQTVTDGLPLVQAAFNFASIRTTLGLVFLGMVGITNLGMDSIANAVIAKMPVVNAAFNFDSARTTLGLVYLGMVGTTNAGMQSIANAVTAGMALVNASFNFTGVNTTLGLVYLGMVGTTNLGMESLANAVTAGMVLVNAAFNFAGVNTTLGLMYLGMVGTTTMGMQSIANAVTAGMPLINAAFDFSIIQISLGLIFQGMIGTVNLGMASIAATIIGGLALINAIWSATWLGTVVAVIRQGWALVQSAVNAANAQVVAAVQGANAQVVALWNSGMAGVVSAVVSGGARVVGGFVSMVSQALGVLRTMIGQAASIGSSIISGLVSAISAGAGRVIGALTSLAQRAVAAARAVIQPGSPSKVFTKIGESIPQGLVAGIEAHIPQVEAAANKMADAAVGTADKISAAFTDTQWAADFSATVEHAFADIAPQTTNADVVGAIRRQSGDLDQGATLGSILAVLQAMYAQSKQGGGAVLTAQASRRAAELGAF